MKESSKETNRETENGAQSNLHNCDTHSMQV